MLNRISKIWILAFFMFWISAILPTCSSQVINFGDISLPSNSFILGDFMTVNYEFSNDNTITMAIQCDIPNQFFGLGLGSSMTDSDLWVFEIVNSEVRASDYYSARATRPTLDTSIGGHNNLEVLGYEITSTYTLVKIRRALDTEDTDNDKVITVGVNDFIYATGNSPTMVYHTRANRGTAEITLVENQFETEEMIFSEENTESMEVEDMEISLPEEQEILEENFFIVEQEINEEDFLMEGQIGIEELTQINEEQVLSDEIIISEEQESQEAIVLQEKESPFFEDQEETGEILTVEELQIIEDSITSEDQEILGENILIDEQDNHEESILIEEQEIVATESLEDFGEDMYLGQEELSEDDNFAENQDDVVMEENVEEHEPREQTVSEESVSMDDQEDFEETIVVTEQEGFEESDSAEDIAGENAAIVQGGSNGNIIVEDQDGSYEGILEDEPESTEDKSGQSQNIHITGTRKEVPQTSANFGKSLFFNCVILIFSILIYV